MKTLLDEHIDVRFKGALTGIEVFTVREMGWLGSKNGVLRAKMEAHGFTVYEYEWWHFDYKDWPSYRIGNIPFDKIK